MKILVVGKINRLYWCEHVVSAFRALGHEVQLFAVNRIPPYKRLLKKLASLVTPDLGERLLARELVACLKRYRPDLVLFVSPFFLPLELFVALEESHVHAIKVGWVGDSLVGTQKVKADHLDHLYVTDTGFIAQAVSIGLTRVSYLPLAFNTEYFSNRRGSARDGIVFVGAYTETRRELLEQIGDVRLQVIGPDWSRLKNASHGITNRNIDIHQLADEYNRHVAVLNIKNEQNVINGLSMRPFEAAACGAVVISDEVDDINKCFDRDREILVYSSASELDMLCERILGQKDFAASIAAAGERRVNAEHTFVHRAKAMLQDLIA